MANEAKLDVLPRRDDETIEQWMNAVFQPSIYLDHRKRSPMCLSNTMEYAKLPVLTDKIGSQPN